MRGSHRRNSAKHGDVDKFTDVVLAGAGDLVAGLAYGRDFLR